MKRIIVLLMFLIMTACARKAEVRVPPFIRADRYAYVKDNDGRVYVVTTSTKDFDEAMKQLQPGPVSVDKLDLWVVTPLGRVKKPKR